MATNKKRSNGLKKAARQMKKFVAKAPKLPGEWQGSRKKEQR